MERGAEEISYLLPSHTRVEHAMLQQELRSLESFRKFLLDSLLDHARPGKSYLRARLGSVQIAEHGIACGYYARRRVRENGYKRQGRFIHSRERCGNLCHLHQRDIALLQAR